MLAPHSIIERKRKIIEFSYERNLNDCLATCFMTQPKRMEGKRTEKNVFVVENSKVFNEN